MQARAVLLLGLFSALLAPPAGAQHLSLWAGYGLGSFLSGGEGRPNSNRLGGFSFTFPGDRVEVRLMRGSFERTDLPIPMDNDADYHLGDLLATRAWTGLPFDVGAGIGRYKQALPEGFPDRIGERRFFRVWGPNLTIARQQPIVRHLLAWGELDAHYAPFRRRETFLTADFGLTLRL